MRRSGVRGVSGSGFAGRGMGRYEQGSLVCDEFKALPNTSIAEIEEPTFDNLNERPPRRRRLKLSKRPRMARQSMPCLAKEIFLFRHHSSATPAQIKFS